MNLWFYGSFIRPDFTCTSHFRFYSLRVSSKYRKGLFRVKMHSLLSRPGSDNSISLWCKLRHTIDLSNYRSWFPFWDLIVSFDLSFYFLFFETCTQPFCKRHYPVIVITITRHVLYTGKCTRLYVLEIIKAWPLCILWTRGHAYLLTQLYKIKTFGKLY